MKKYSLYPSLIYRVIFAVFVCLLVNLFLLPARSALAQSNAYVRIIHASPFVGTADVFVDGKDLLSSFQFGAVTDYVPLPQGPHHVQIALVGKGMDASIITQDLSVNAGYTYTVAAVGASATTLGLQVFVDNNQVTANRAKVRFYYLSPNAGSATVNVGGDFTLSNIPYLAASNYVTEDVGPCPLSFTDPQHSSYPPMTMNLKANTVTSIFSVGLFEGNPKEQLVEADAPGIPGLPGTGSYPTAIDKASEQPIVSWLLIAALLAFLSVPVVFRLRQRA